MLDSVVGITYGIEHMFDVGEQVDEQVMLDSWDGWEQVFGRCIPADLASWTPDGIPDWLDDLPAGPVLAEALDTLDLDRISPADRVIVLRARQRLIAHHQAAFHADVAAIADGYADPDPTFTRDGTSAEIRAALRLTRRAADMLVDRALDLHRRLPALLDALAAGRIDLARVRVIADRTTHLPVAHARLVCDQVVDTAMQSTTGQLRARVDRRCLELDPDGARARENVAVADRSVTSELTEDGTVTLAGWNLPAADAARAAHHSDQLARSLRTNGETRTMDQLRADVFVDLLTGNSPHRATTLHVTVDLDTLSRLADRPGDLAGYGPITADIARQVADAATRVDWTVTHPDSGQPVVVGTTRRRPTASQRRAVTARNRTCIFPGCRQPATGADLDHTNPWSNGGRTCADNLAPLCRHHHVIRHRHRWTYQRSHDGDHTWTSPLGHRHTTSGRSP